MDRLKMQNRRHCPYLLQDECYSSAGVLVFAVLFGLFASCNAHHENLSKDNICPFEEAEEFLASHAVILDSSEKTIALYPWRECMGESYYLANGGALQPDYSYCYAPSMDSLVAWRLSGAQGLYCVLGIHKGAVSTDRFGHSIPDYLDTTVIGVIDADYLKRFVSMRDLRRSLIPYGILQPSPWGGSRWEGCAECASYLEAMCECSGFSIAPDELLDSANLLFWAKYRQLEDSRVRHLSQFDL